MASILVASAAMPFVLAIWVCRRVESSFVLHGALVGVVAALLYVIVAWGQPEPLLYKVAHGLKVVGGVAGGRRGFAAETHGGVAAVRNGEAF